MGNVCSSGQKKKKDSTSEKSDDSYKIENTVEDNVKSPESELIQTKADDKNEGNISTVLNYQTNVQDPSNIVEQQCTEKALLHTNTEMLNTDLCKLLGRAKWNGNDIDKMNKIIIYLIMDNTSNSLKHKHLIYDIKTHLEKICEMHNFEIAIADVHNSSECLDKTGNESERNILNVEYWSEEAACFHNTRTYYESSFISRSEMKRHLETSYVIPILFFGTSMGIPILPLTIKRDDFLGVLNSLNQDERLLLEKWYGADDSNCYNLDIQHFDNNIEIEVNKELNKLLHILLNCLTKNNLKPSYISTIIEPELNNIIINNPEVAKRCIWIQSDPQYVKLNENPTAVELQMMQRIAQYHLELKSCISEKNVIRIPPNIKILESELISILRRLLENTVQSIIEEHSINLNLTQNTNGIDHILIKELEFINLYTKKISKRSDGGDDEIEKNIIPNIKRYIQDSTDYPLIISGPAGSGKTTLTSKIASSIHDWKPDVNIILRYAKLTAESSDLVTILGSLVNQMSALINGNQIKTEHTLERYTQIICDIINNRKCCFVIIMDAIDDLLEDEDNNDIKLNWLPTHMCNMCKIILTITEGKRNYKALIEKLKERGIPERAYLKVNALSQSQWNKMLRTNNVSNNVLKKIPQEWYQLHGKTIFHVRSLRWLLHLGSSALSINNISEVSEIILNVMETKLSPEYVEIFLLIICLPEWGIPESDCVGIFKNITKLDTQIVLNLWARFCWIISPMLLDIGNLRAIDNVFKNFILQKYRQKHRAIHLVIRDYYQKQERVILKKDGPSIKIYNYAKYLMEPYHHLQILIGDNANQNIHNQLLDCMYFADMQWITDKVNAVGPLCLIHDIFVFERIAREFTSKDCVHINFLKNFLIKYVHELNYDGNQFITLFKYHVKIIIDDGNNLDFKCDEKIRLWLQFIEDLKTPFLEILNDSINNANEETGDETEGDQCIYDALINLPNDGYFIASISALKEQVCIWDVQQCLKVRVLEGIPQPTALCPLGSHEAAILCRREIKVIDLDEGKLKVTLKGVMNQKMPYFGLHDQKHLVCLSRNRMYVNLMDMESGDCVTTFKAGEDRFLNSLLVSGDGRILVCGDETQKPFPLLVWHLSQRKLLYDLRIPCHDFITSLSAITYEGSYVCVVAKELNEPAPNFIVVYDLQSGTLFKKWKPACNTVALAISQLNACVIAGLYDAKILIWDLVTGNCRATLTGHNAPVTCLKLDPLGKILLSTNKEGRDNSLRMWELNSGNSVAVFKPPGRVSACEILPNGNYVAIGLFDRTDLVILALRNYKDNSTKSIVTNTLPIYGKLDNQHKVFKLEIT